MLKDEEKVRDASKFIFEKEKNGKIRENIVEEEQSMEKQMQAIIQIRKLSQGEYFERVTPQYELILEYHKNTLHISLYTVREKNYFLLV